MKLKSVLPATFLSMLILSGTACSINRASTANKAKTSMVGMKKVEILACMGAPDSSAKDGEMEVMTYHHQGDSTHAAVGNALGSSHLTLGKTNQRTCTANVVLQRNMVTQVNYRGKTGGMFSQGEQCAYLVENCVN